MFLVNKSAVDLPAPELSAKDEARLDELTARAHLSKPDRHDPYIKPLTFEERKELVALRLRKNDTMTPKYGGVFLPIPAKGKPGSCLDVADDVAQTLVRQHPERLEVLHGDADPPVKPVRPGAKIDAYLAGARQAANHQVFIREGKRLGAVVRDDVVVSLGGQAIATAEAGEL